jgi:hypothetical protein
MEWGEYLGGFAVFVPMAGGVTAGALIICRRRLPGLRGVTRALAIALVITLGLIAVHLVPGMLGLLARGSVLVCTGLWLGAALLVRPAPGVSEPSPAPPSSGRAAVVLAAGGAVSIAAATLALGSDGLFLAPGSIDILNFHLPGIASWIQDGSIWGVHEFVADVSPGRYPNNGDLVLLAAILPWHSDFLSHLVPYAYYLLAGLATYAVAIELGASRAAATTAGSLLLAMPIVALPALANSFPDVIMFFGFATGVVFLLRHRRTAATADLVLAGLALGLAFGTKWYGVSAVAVVVAIWTVGSRIDGRAWRTLARQAITLSVLIATAGGVWMLRNWIQSGNPVYPVEVSVFGLTIFSAPVDVVRELAGFTIAGYLGDGEVWIDWILPQYRDAFAWVGPLVVVGLALAVGALTSPLRARLNRGPLAVVLAAALLIAITYAVTPYTAGGAEGEPTLVYVGARYLVPAILLALALIAAVTPAASWGPTAFSALGLVAIWDGIRLAGIGELSGAQVGARDWAVAIALVALTAAIVWVVRREPNRRRGRAALAAIAAVSLVAVAVAGFELQRRFLEHRYVGIDPTTDWIREHAAAGANVGLAGRWTTHFSPALPSFGPRFENDVAYVGEFVDGTLRAYRDQSDFIAALRDRDPDLLVIGQGFVSQPRVPEQRWAEEAGFEPVVISPRFSLYRAAPGS